MKEVELVSWATALDQLSLIVRDRAAVNNRLRVVEAGCGRQWGLKVDPDSCFITGIDTDAAALEARARNHGDLHRQIIGDVQNPNAFDPGSADVVYSAYVLEHLPRAEEAARGWVTWLADYGTLIALIPDAQSVYGWVSRVTPHRLHIWAYRVLLGRAEAGTPGHAPYPVHYSSMLTVGGLKRFARSENLRIDAIYAIGDMQRNVTPRDKVQNRLFAAVKQVLSTVSGGRLRWRHDNLAVVMTKRPPHAEP